MEKWVVSAKKADFQQIANKFGIDPVVARLIRNREQITDEEIDTYLHGKITELHSWKLLKGMESLLDILTEKIKEQKKIRIIGDYDIDGVCSTYILLKGLKRAGAAVDVDIPDRMKDGYGISRELIDLAKEAGTDTIITCDNGISAIEQIAYAKELGMTVLVTDHHEVPYEEQEDGSIRTFLPDADAIVNPKQEDCGYPFKGICGGMVAFKVICGLYEKLGIPFKEAEELIPFAAIATVGDVMDLVDENRILVKDGLRRLQNPENEGLKALIRVNNLENREITAYHIGFVLGPCMNASGRLSTAKRALQLLLSQDVKEASVLAEDLKNLNDSRKDMTAKGVEQAVELVETTDLLYDRVLVIYLPDCHESLAGIIAGRIRERYTRPVFVLTRAEEGVKGSGRSIEAYHMFQEMVKCKELLTKFGGHPMAAGLSLPEENVEAFRRKLNENCVLTQEDMIEKIVIDVPMPMSYVTIPLIRQLSQLEPFGKGNTKPVFAQKKLRFADCRVFGKNRNVVKMQGKDEFGFTAECIWFGDGDDFLEKLREKECWDVIYYPSVNVFRGRESIEMVIQNIR
ncbi:single-stranded-DNA-specific exonuclease RecJ [Blautia hansenii]|uniref:Single-stranded-DNA-specific exonuclease RecJ n=1 Tax=Blautia hansenii TaxID=1322 RepID=A0ABX2I9B5_BLAHA|nr:single-stranded-DNA-specific exonuclease RecJ [Blautia hansenii]MCB5601109.1 single-stranded-DNA-specific exonuclease RecJ [Blautia hansenii]NSJ85717.1 single-stranded-DNA-specific exonuclease RecJ [Blautia hansenii]